jgi:EAL domain-containing protein (putative c-di-GMP-specific phosphodiesterase class I)
LARIETDVPEIKSEAYRRMDHFSAQVATLQAEADLSWLCVHGLRSVFQPIVNLEGVRPRVIAVEALARGPRGTAVEMPASLFLAARRANRIAELDRRCIEVALLAAQDLPAHLDLFLNVHPSTLCSDWEFPAFLASAAADAGIAPSRLTMELLEHARVDRANCRQLRGALQVLRGLGVRLAVDDVSGSPDDLRRALSLEPDYLKVDAWVVRGSKEQPRQRALLHAITHESQRAGVRVIAEGIEDLHDMEAIVDAGIHLGQGYLLSRPAPVEAFAHLSMVA